MAKVLVIEDDELMCKALNFRLKKENHEVMMAIDGKDAIGKLKEGNFDLIITDIMLPYISGLEIIKSIKKRNEIAQIPIIVLSASGLENVVMQAFSLGITDFITKPFNMTELMLRVKIILN